MGGKYTDCNETKVFMGPPVSIGKCVKKRRHDDEHTDTKGRTWANVPRNHRR